MMRGWPHARALRGGPARSRQQGPGLALGPFLASVPLTPFGRAIVACAAGRSPASLPARPLERWLVAHRLLVLRGFAPLRGAALGAFARAFGEVTGADHGDDEAAPCILSGARVRSDGEVAMHSDRFSQGAPRYLFFQCDAAPLAGAGGETFFCDRARLWRASSPIERCAWVLLSGAKETTTSIGAPQSARDLTEPEDDALDGPWGLVAARLRERLYDPELCYVHTWAAGDLVLADNGALLHARAPFPADARRIVRRASVL